MSRRATGIAVFALLCAASWPHSSSAQSAGLALTPCRLPRVEREVSCGTWNVYENRTAAAGREIGLRVVVLPAKGAPRSPDPLIFFTGGPGEAASGEAALIEHDWAAILEHRDVLLVDARGTGGSNPLPCSWGDPIRDFESALSGFLPADLVKHCLPLAQSHADLRFYATSPAVDDVDDVRRALGYSRVNIGGASYGTRAAQEYLRRHGDAVRSAFFWDVLPTGARMPVTFARDAQNAFDGVAAACARDTSCHRAFPDPSGDLSRALARFEKGAVSVEIESRDVSGRRQVKLSRGGFSQALRYMLYSPRTAARIPLEVHHAALGDFRPIASTAYGSTRELISGIFEGAYLSVTCGEDVPFYTEEEAAAAAAGTFLGDVRWRAQKEACRLWPRVSVPETFLEPVRSDVPSLLIGGKLDPVNPPRNIDAVARTLSRSRTLLVDRGAHDFEGMEGADCVNRVIADFIASGDEKTIDTRCADRIRPPPFALE